MCHKRIHLCKASFTQKVMCSIGTLSASCHLFTHIMVLAMHLSLFIWKATILYTEQMHKHTFIFSFFILFLHVNWTHLRNRISILLRCDCDPLFPPFPTWLSKTHKYIQIIWYNVCSYELLVSILHKTSLIFYESTQTLEICMLAHYRPNNNNQWNTIRQRTQRATHLVIYLEDE